VTGGSGEVSPPPTERFATFLEENDAETLWYVSMFVSNQDKALDFYTNVVGFEKRVDVPPAGARFLTVGVKGQDVEFLLWPGSSQRFARGG
jgi:hypothetical protein